MSRLSLSLMLALALAATSPGVAAKKNPEIDHLSVA